MLDQRFVAVFVRLLGDLNNFCQQSRIGAGGPAGIGYRQRFFVLAAAQQRAQIQLGIAQVAVIRLSVGRNANAVQLDILGVPLADGLAVGIGAGVALHVQRKAADRLVRGGQQFFPQIILAQVMDVLLCHRQPCTAFQLIGIRIDAGHAVRDPGGLLRRVALLAKHLHAVCAAVWAQCVLVIIAQQQPLKGGADLPVRVSIYMDCRFCNKGGLFRIFFAAALGQFPQRGVKGLLVQHHRVGGCQGEQLLVFPAVLQSQRIAAKHRDLALHLVRVLSAQFRKGIPVFFCLANGKAQRKGTGQCLAGILLRQPGVAANDPPQPLRDCLRGVAVRQLIRTQLCRDPGRFFLGIALVLQGCRLCCKGQRGRQVAIDQQFCQLLLRLLLGGRFQGLYRFRRGCGFFCHRGRSGHSGRRGYRGRGRRYSRRGRLCRSSVVKTQGLHPEAGNGKDVVQRDVHLPVWQQHGQHRAHNIRLHWVAHKTSVRSRLEGNRFVDIWNQLLAHIKTQFHNAVIPFYSRFFRGANLYADGDTCLNKSILQPFCRIKGYSRHSA